MDTFPSIGIVGGNGWIGGALAPGPEGFGLLQGGGETIGDEVVEAARLHGLDRRGRHPAVVDKGGHGIGRILAGLLEDAAGADQDADRGATGDAGAASAFWTPWPDPKA